MVAADNLEVVLEPCFTTSFVIIFASYSETGGGRFGGHYASGLRCNLNRGDG